MITLHSYAHISIFFNIASVKLYSFPCSRNVKASHHCRRFFHNVPMNKTMVWQNIIAVLACWWPNYDPICVRCHHVSAIISRCNISRYFTKHCNGTHYIDDHVSNHQPHGCLLNRLFRRRSKKTSQLRVNGLCVGNSPGPVNSTHKGPVTRKMFPFDDVIMTKPPHISPSKGSDRKIDCVITYCTTKIMLGPCRLNF